MIESAWRENPFASELLPLPPLTLPPLAQRTARVGVSAGARMATLVTSAAGCRGRASHRPHAADSCTVVRRAMGCGRLNIPAAITSIERRPFY